MSYALIFTDSYKKRVQRFARQHPELKEQYRKTLLLLAQNPQHPSLRLHPLKGKLAALHSVSINLSYRITLEMIISEQEIILVNVGRVMVIFIKLEQMCSENRASINLYKASKSYVFRSLRATFFVFIDYSMHYAAFEVVIY